METIATNAIKTMSTSVSDLLKVKPQLKKKRAAKRVSKSVTPE
jgi:hypothetical protein